MARPGSAATTGRGKRSAADASFSASSMTSASASTSPETDGMAWPLPMFSSVRMTPCRARTSALADHPANRLAVEVRLADLRADMAGQAHQIEDGVCEQALHGVGGMVTAEGGGHRVVAMDVDAQALLTGPARHRGGQQRLAGVDDVRPAQRLAVAAGATPGSPLRRRRRSGCEIVGDVDQRYAAHTEPAVVVAARRRRPDRGIEPRGSRVTDGRKTSSKVMTSTARAPIDRCRFPYGPLTKPGPILTTLAALRMDTP